MIFHGALASLCCTPICNRLDLVVSRHDGRAGRRLAPAVRTLDSCSGTGPLFNSCERKCKQPLEVSTSSLSPTEENGQKNSSFYPMVLILKVNVKHESVWILKRKKYANANKQKS